MLTRMEVRWVWAIALAGAVFVVVALGAWRLARIQDPETRSLLRRVGRLPWRDKARLAWALLRDRRIPLWVRALVPALLLYLATPVDLIPDFIPVLGHLDDLVVALVLGGALLRFAPRPVVEEHIARLEAVSAAGAGPAR
jgi:uncharacterized membrane protein YkvA (DUF1232 family)